MDQRSETFVWRRTNGLERGRESRPARRPLSGRFLLERYPRKPAPAGANGAGEIAPISITTELKKSYLDYAMSVIVSRALPDVRDGLKPVHRRILYADVRGRLHRTTKAFKKSANTVGDVIGRYHPHGDQSIYDALVRMAQPFAMSVPADRGAGQLRLDRRRSAGGHALHRKPDGAHHREPARRHRQGHGRTSTTTMTARARSRPSCRPSSRTCWSTGQAASPSAWRPTCRRTT